MIVNTVLYVRDELGRGASDVAWALAASGAGALLAALALPRVLVHVRDRTVMLAGGTLLGLGLALAAVAQTFGSLLAVWFLLGVGLSLAQTPGGRLLQRSGSPAERPALFAAQFSLSHACWLATYPLAGVLGAALGLATTALLFAVLAAGAVALAAAMWRPAGSTYDAAVA